MLTRHASWKCLPACKLRGPLLSRMRGAGMQCVLLPTTRVLRVRSIAVSGKGAELLAACSHITGTRMLICMLLAEIVLRIMPSRNWH